MLKIYTILLCLLLFRFAIFYASLPVRKDGGTISVQGQLVKEPAVSKGAYVLEVENTKTYVPIKTVYHYGDYVAISGILKCYDVLICANPVITKPTVFLLARSNKEEPRSLRSIIINVYRKFLKRSEAQVVAGMVLGASEMDQELKNDLASAGLIHLVVASGMNLTLVGGFFFALFTSLHFHKRWIVIASSLSVILYSALTGFEPPIVRALVMFEAVMVGGLVGRKSGGLFALIVAAYLMLWVSPALTINFSFLLSFASMMGQILVSTIRVRLPALIRSLVLVVLQNFFAIVFTTPIILIGFARFSLVSIVSNLLVVWMVEIVMVLGAVAGIVGIFSIGLARIILTPLGYLLGYFLFIVKMFGENEKWVLRLEGVDLAIAIGYYLVLFSIIYHLLRRDSKPHSLERG